MEGFDDAAAGGGNGENARQPLSPLSSSAGGDEPVAAPKTTFLNAIEEALEGAKPKYAVLKTAIAEAAGVPSVHVNPKNVSAHNQVSPRTSESRTNRFKAGSPDDWVFVGLVSAPREEQPNTVDAIERELLGLATVAPIFVKDGGWKLSKLFYEEGHHAKAEALREALGAPASLLQSYPAITTAKPAAAQAEESQAPPEMEAAELFWSDGELHRLRELLSAKGNLVLQGPPGTGKTLVAKWLASSVAGASERVARVQFHPSFDYSDFIRGWRPAESGFSLHDGVFHRFCESAKQHPDEAWVFIIDEMNRGNLSSIFGEVLSLLEMDKRHPRDAVRLAYMRKDEGPFFVPKNVFVVGTMNTADRSLAFLDYALRRRFAFVEVAPAFERPEFTDFLLTKGVSPTVVDSVVERMTDVNERITRDTKNLGPGYEVGHSYFCPRVAGKYGRKWYDRIVKFEVLPLLAEYWFDQPDALQKAAAILTE